MIVALNGDDGVVNVGRPILMTVPLTLPTAVVDALEHAVTHIATAATATDRATLTRRFFHRPRPRSRTNR